MGLELPPELMKALSWVGCTWPDADETGLFHCGEYWGDFADRVAEHSEAAGAAVRTMLAENRGEGIDAFATYWEKLTGEDGYLLDCGIVAGAVSVAFYSAGVLVLTLKILVIVQLAAFALILAAAVAAALFTLGASLAAAAEAAAVVNRTIVELVAATIATIRELGGPLSELAQQHLSKEIDRLQGRPIHSSAASADHFDTQQERDQDRQEYERRKDELARDAAKGGQSDADTEREAEVALGLEQVGAVKEPVRRASDPRADFTDGDNQDWDVKGFRTMPDDPRRDYDRAKAEANIQKKLDRGTNVALDLAKLSQADRDDLRELVLSRPEWAGRVVVY